MKKWLTKKFGIISIMLLLCLTVLAGCGNEETKEKEDSAAKQEQAGDSAFPVTFTDDSGKEVTIDEKPEKIISVLPSTTETLFALGAGERVVGVSEYDTYPEEVKDIQKVGSMELNTEVILSLLPDIIFVQDTHADNYKEVLTQFEEAGITTVVIGSESATFEEAFEGIELIGKATGTSEKAEEIITGMEQKMDEIKEKAKAITEKKKVLVEIQPEPTIFAAGGNTFIDEMLSIIGAENAAGDQEGWPEYTEEEAVALNPDVIIATYGDYVENPVGLVLARKGWQEVGAIKNKQVYAVDSDTVTRPSPRLTDGVEELAKAIYPEIFE